MKVSIEGAELVLKPSGWRAETRIVLSQLTRWDMLYEVLGRRYVAFHLGDRTAYAQLPNLQPEERLALLAQLSVLTGRAPDISLLDGERDNEHWAKVWEMVKAIGRYLRLFINPLRSPKAPPRRANVPPQH